MYATIIHKSLKPRFQQKLLLMTRLMARLANKCRVLLAALLSLVPSQLEYLYTSVLAYAWHQNNFFHVIDDIVAVMSAGSYWNVIVGK